MATFSCVCEGMSLSEAVRADIDRYLHAAERNEEASRRGLPRMLLSFRIWSLLTHRLAHVAVTRVRPRSIGRVIGTASFLAHRLLTALTGIEIDPHAHLGPGLLIPHAGHVVIGPVRVGRHCTISQGVTLGQGLTADVPADEDIPLLGDRVWVGPGAVVAGKVRIGSDAVIGANTVVLRDVPSRGVVLGVPGRLVSRAGSFHQVRYRGMDQDPERTSARVEALAEAPQDGS